MTDEVTVHSWQVAVALDAPAHVGLPALLSYRSRGPVVAGQLLRVPLGRQELTGVAWDDPAETASDVPASALRDVAGVLDSVPPLPLSWRALVAFAASYYQRALGEVALAALPPALRSTTPDKLAAQVARWQRAQAKRAASDTPPRDAPPPLSAEQAAAWAAVDTALAAPEPPCQLLWGATGSGKTEVYLRATASALAAGKQVLVLVPEINLTPQLQARFIDRLGSARVALMHSALPAAQRLAHWLAVLHGQADVVLGTRLAVFAPLPRLGLIVVDEEHDPSYKQQDGARYSARDLAVWRGRSERAAVVLGSATPSLETWQHAAQGRYGLLTLHQRVADAAMPNVRLLDMRRRTPRAPASAPASPPAPAPAPDSAVAAANGDANAASAATHAAGIAEAISATQATDAAAVSNARAQQAALDRVLHPDLVAAIDERLARREQVLLFLNRRGYAPVLACGSCDWKSACPHCSAWRVFHKLDRTLRCHHCGASQRVPRACPQCGDTDIQPLGRGTERLEDEVAAHWPQARVARIDADTARRQGALAAQLAAVHDGEIDILVGTQMVTKGHDFRRVTLVAALDPDGALYSSDFRAAERMFATLMQAAGRAGRSAALAGSAEMWVQTALPEHPLYLALARHDFAAFAATLLAERRTVGLPPFSHLALVRAEARSAAVVEEFLKQVRAQVQQLATSDPSAAAVHAYPPVPPALSRVAGLERRQLLIESPQRAPLQRLLARLAAQLQAERAPVARWAIDVDPQLI